jgi:hypothetical protein
MRIWTLHPKYLDSRGLVALWRETLLAQAVLRGQTRGYTHHPQLIRFQESSFPQRSIACYLQAVLGESIRRGYRFDKTKIPAVESVEPLAATQGQLDYEWEHLQEKLRQRDPSWLAGLQPVSTLDPHPLFRIVPGAVADWEIIKKTPSAVDAHGPSL